MLEIQNKTPYAAAIAPGLDATGRDLAIVAIKASFAIDAANMRLTVADEQEPVAHATAFAGEPGFSSLLRDCETSPAKPGTDIALYGSAYTPDGKEAESVDAGLRVGPVQKAVRVFGDRVWQSGFGSWRASKPRPFTRMPLSYERAYGGKDQLGDKPETADWEPRNPIGAGFAISGRKDRLEGRPLPNLEDPNQPIRHWRDRPPPAGFGLIPGDWAPRRDYAGSYDQAWRDERAPLLPKDFQPRFHHAAHPDLQTAQPLEGGETIEALNLSADGPLRLEVPRRQFELTFWIRQERKKAQPRLDTVIIEPDQRRLIALWRAVLPCPRQFLYIQRTRIEEIGNGRP